MDYANGSGDEEAFYAYYRQACETDARDYAFERASAYEVIIARYLERLESQSMPKE